MQPVIQQLVPLLVDGPLAAPAFPEGTVVVADAPWQSIWLPRSWRAAFLSRPPLRRLELHYSGLSGDNADYVTSDLTAISLLARGLEAVTLNIAVRGQGFEPGSEIPMEGLERVVTTCPRFRCLEISAKAFDISITDTLADGLSSLAGLTSLTLDVGIIDTGNVHLSLAALTYLELTAPSVTITGFLQAATLPSVQTLDLHFVGVFQSDIYDESVGCFARTSSPSQLRIVRIYLSTPLECNYYEPQASMLRLAEPFFGCHEMEQFSVYSYRFQLVRWTEDRGPTDISGGWPKLTEFLFNIGDQETGKLAKVPSVVLEQFAANCPALEHLVLPCIDDFTELARIDIRITRLAANRTAV